MFNMAIYHLCSHETLVATICSFKNMFENTFLLVFLFLSTWYQQT